MSRTLVFPRVLSGWAGGLGVGNHWLWGANFSLSLTVPVKKQTAGVLTHSGHPHSWHYLLTSSEPH